eukprot:TRINITY_DN12393_c1_g1_i6.p1 TRINITY_DN12393_c1_g1~~TRINITY_DN12393_c1_g1_i6.p1  ORF type:complete len:276 (+),score=1.30 TRINITY_DN12393_c1_g1_i6:304-1131(+)
MPRQKKLQFCQVCGICVAHLPHYFNRFKVCKECQQKPEVLINNHFQRFCNKCGQFETLSKFDGQKRTCRVKLEQHNRLRKEGNRRSRKNSDVEVNLNKLPSLDHTSTAELNIISSSNDQSDQNPNPSFNYQSNEQYMLCNGQYDIFSPSKLSPKSPILPPGPKVQTLRCDQSPNLNVNQQTSLLNQNQTCHKQNNDKIEKVNIEEQLLCALQLFLGIPISCQYFLQVCLFKQEAVNFTNQILTKYFTGEYDKQQLNYIICILEMFQVYIRMNNNS